MMAPSPELDYAPPPPVHGRRAFRRALVAGTLISLLIAGWAFVPRYWRVIQFMGWQRAAMRFTLPPDTVVVEPDRVRGAKLWQVGSDYVTRPPGSVYHVPRINGERRTSDMIFIHGRRRPDGGVRLVQVSEGMDGGGKAILTAWVAKPVTVLHPQMGGFDCEAALPPGPPGERPRLYAGQPDPNDPSRFTIRYEYTDRAGTTYGRLLDDDTVSFEHAEDPPRKAEVRE